MAAAAGQRDQEGNLPAQPRASETRRAGPRRAGARPHPPASPLRLADPQAPLRRLHAGDGGAGLRRPARRCSPRSARCSSPTPAASGRRRSSTASAGPSTRSARSTSARRRSCSCCSGNMGRPGGGVMAMRGHASIQGSSDIPTLFDTLPGYIPMPHAHAHADLDEFIAGNAPDKGFWGNMRAYMVSLLKAWWGEAATADNDYCFDYLPAADRQPQHLRHGDGADRRPGQGLHAVRPEPGGGLGQLPDAAARHVQARLARRPRLLAHRERHLVEGRPRDRVRRDAHARTSPPRCSSSRRPPTPRRTGRSPTPSAWCSGTTRRSSPTAEQRSDLWFIYHLGNLIRERLAGSTDDMDRPVLDLTWRLPDGGPLRRPRRGGRSGRDQRLERRRRAAVGLYRAQGRRVDVERLLDLLRRLCRGRQPDGPPQARARAELDRR